MSDTKESRTGLIGSVAVHLVVVGGAFLLAFMRPAEAELVDAQDPILLEVWQGDGSERDPGIPGAARGVAEGMSTGDKSKVGLGGLPRIRSINADKLINNMKEADRRAAVEQAAAQKAAQAERDAEKRTTSTKADPTAPGSNKSKTSQKESLDAFLKSSAGKAVAKPTNSGSGSGKATGSGATMQSARVGSGTGTGTGSGTGADGLGRPTGTGANGGDGGSGREDALFAGDVRGKFAEIFIPLFRDEGGDLDSESDRATVDVLVSASGIVSFSGWYVRPNSSVTERLVREAIRKMPPTRRPPGGKPITVRIPLKGTVVD